jgi:GNAT superfamily N-acetyltransferase
MEIRPMSAGDLLGVQDIDATVESAEYLHILREGEGLNSTWKIEPRRLSKARTHRNVLGDEAGFAVKQIVAGVEEGIALVAEHEDQIAGAAAALVDGAGQVLRLVDLRVDFEFRRQGLGSGLVFQLIQHAREKEMRAVSARTISDNFPAAEFLAKLNFELTGFDTHFHSNHDLLKDSVVLFWYLQLK